MSSPPRRLLQTRGRNRPARNALHPPRGARSAVACCALSGAPAPSRARQSGLPRGPRAERGGSGMLPGWPEPVIGVAPSPRSPRRRPVGHHRRWRRHFTSETASPAVADVPVVAPWRIGGPVVLHDRYERRKAKKRYVEERTCVWPSTGQRLPSRSCCYCWTPVDLSPLKPQWGTTAQSSPISAEIMEKGGERPDAVSGTRFLESAKKRVLDTAAMRSSLK